MVKHLFLAAFLVSIVLATGVYNQSKARVLATYSAINHCDQEAIQAWSCKECKNEPLEDVVVIENKLTKIFGYIGYRADWNQIVLAWRGTDNTRNWVEDFNFEQILYARCLGCEIHTGFYTAYYSVQSQVHKAVDAHLAKHPDATFVVTGHSLGGALATFCALELQIKYNSKVKSLINFGCPRVGNAAMAQFINNKLPEHFRVVHNRDIVPHVPFDFMNYHHINSEVFYDSEMNSYKICDESGEDKSCSNKFFPEYSFDDHDLYFINQSGGVC